ncbi:MAG: squalene/phytoene synthase family protein [Labilithrix sp.]|nr:squalene/phytoene synthase family protein [Labilithrix sp.]MCW5832599.1 squalene/phytoene synthase family protein [Labilithrix sp.]
MRTTTLADPDLARLLERTSRTFALAIPLLEAPLARQVGVAYLLFRIADELEDAALWSRDRRAAALASFVRWLDGEDAGLNWPELVARTPPTRDAGCLELLSRAPDVLAAVRAMDAGVATAIVAHVKRTALGMAEFVARQDEGGGITLADVDDLRRYAYVVAGIVGELLTELFAVADPRAAAAREALDADAASFGEGLQLVNILKDAPADAREGRAYLPADVPRGAIVELARADLARAERYVRTLVEARASRGVVMFCDLPVRLAIATLAALDAGAPKLAREDALGIVAAVTSRR